MLEAVKRLGEYDIEKRGLNDAEILIQKSKLANTKKVICVVFEQKNSDVFFDHVHIEDYNQAESGRYLYRTFRDGKHDATPTAIMTSLEKVKNRWDQWFRIYSEKYKSNQLINLLSDEVQTKKEEIFNEISKKYETLNKEEKKKLVLTIKIKEGGKEKFIGDFNIFRDILKEMAKEKFYYKHNVFSKGDGICSLCKGKGEVLGFASPFSVFTVDKKGFAPEFLRENSWKQLPVCEHCAISLEAGKEFLDNYLRKKFYGYQFYVIPHFIFGKIQEDIIEDIKDLNRRKYSESLLGEEDDILDLMKEKKNVINLIFVFLKPKQKDYFDIVRYVEDVPPTWIKKLFDTIKKINNNKSIFKQEYLKKLFGKKWSEDFINASWKGKKLPYMNMAGMIRVFFPQSRKTGIYDKYFIDLVGDILAQRAISEDLIVNAFVREIRNKHVKQDSWNEALYSLKSLFLLTFINELGLSKGGYKVDERAEKKELNLKTSGKNEEMEKFFADFANAFNASDKKAVFLMGVLAKFLLDVQFASRDSTPFRSRLYGLKLDGKRIKKIFPEILEKLSEYKTGYPWLVELISRYLVETENNGWSLSKDEISYYFALGLNLGKFFKEREGEESE